MARDEDEPTMKWRRLDPLVLDSLSIDELHGYIMELQAEIGRAEADTSRKTGHRSAADAFFKKP